MNWTGGTLQRLKAGRQNGVLQKQKEYFAKVRVQLQSAPNLLASPFRPSYLQGGDFNLGDRLPSLGFGTVRYAGIKRRQLQARRDIKESHTASNIQYRQGVETYPAAGGISSRRKGRYESALPTNSNDPKRKRKAAGADPEDQLLEAKKMRLLQRQDWVGLAVLRPVNMHFLSSKEKDRIGKRRKIGGRPVGHRKSSEPPRKETFHLRPYMSRASPIRRDEDIRIRIGTDALTTRTSMQHTSHVQLQTAAPSRAQSSDPMSDTMLFDNESLYAASEEPVQHARITSPKYSMSLGLSTGLHAVSPHASFEGEGAHELSQTQRKHSRISYGRREADTTEKRPNQQNRGGNPAFHSTYQVGGAGRHLRFVLDQPSDTLHVGGATDTTDAGLMAYEHEKADQDSRDHPIPGADCARPPSIVDDGRGKYSHASPDDSSCCSTMGGRPRFGLSRLPQLQMTTSVEVGFAEVSQHAILGDQPRTSTLSLVSASLPSIKSNRQSEQRALKDGDQEQSAKRIKKQEKWQSFVREGGKDLESDTRQGESSIAMRFVRGSPRRPHSSLAAVSRITDDVLEVAHRKPHSTASGCISSPEAPEIYAELSEVDETTGRSFPAKHSIYNEEESLIQASIVNSMSHNMDTTMSRNGSGRSCGSDFGPALAKRSECSRQVHESFMYNTPESASEGIDLVDSERLW